MKYKKYIIKYDYLNYFLEKYKITKLKNEKYITYSKAIY